MMRGRGFRVVVIAPPGEAPPGIEGIEYRFAPIEREIAVWRDVVALFVIWRILREVRPVVCNMSTPKMGLLGGIAAWIARVPHRVYTLRGLRYQTARRAKRLLLMGCEKLACACAHRVICISRSVQQAAIRDRIAPLRKTLLLGERVSEGLTLKPGFAMPGGVSRGQFGIPETADVIGFVGRLTKDKGIAELVDAFRILQREGANVRLLLVGAFENGDPVPAAAERFIREDPSVHWVGSVANAAPYYALMDIFVFPTHREGLGRVLLEAAAAGKPVVAARTTGVVDVVFDEVTGLLVPPGDAPALSRAIRTLLSDRERARAMGERARALLCQEFDNSVYLNRLAAVLEEFVRPVSTKEGLPQGRSID